MVDCLEKKKKKKKIPCFNKALKASNFENIQSQMAMLAKQKGVAVYFFKMMNAIHFFYSFSNQKSLL